MDVDTIAWLALLLIAVVPMAVMTFMLDHSDDIDEHQSEALADEEAAPPKRRKS